MANELVVLIDTSGSLTWIGEAPVGTLQSASSWKIYRVNEATSGTIVSYADGETTYTKAWSSRTSFSYTVS
jgi:hypothetical protein